MCNKKCRLHVKFKFDFHGSVAKIDQNDVTTAEIFFDPNDSGVLNVPQSALSKFPKNANITIVLMRGNAKIIDKGNKKHYLVTSSEQYERIVLED